MLNKIYTGLRYICNTLRHRLMRDDTSYLKEENLNKYDKSPSFERMVVGKRRLLTAEEYYDWRMRTIKGKLLGT